MAAVEPTLSLGGGPRVRRRRIVNRLAELIALIAALTAVAVLAIVILSVAKRGAGALSLDFLTKSLPVFGQAGGGIAPLIVGSAIGGAGGSSSGGSAAAGSSTDPADD